MNELPFRKTLLISMVWIFSFSDVIASEESDLEEWQKDAWVEHEQSYPYHQHNYVGAEQEVERAKAAHKVELNREKREGKSRFKKWSLGSYAAKVNYKMNQSKTKKGIIEERKRLLGAKYRWNFANDITQCATKMIEKHYAGTASFIEGAAFLKKLQGALENRSADSHKQLEAIFINCQNSLASYKKEKNKKEIRRDKVFTSEQEAKLTNELERIFPDERRIVELLQKAYSSEMECHNSKGATLGFAVGLGAYAGGYRQKCRTPLGRRFKIYKSHLGLNYGGGGVLTTSVTALNWTHHPKVPMHSTPTSVKFDHHDAGAFVFGAGAKTSVPVGCVKKVTQRKERQERNVSKVETLISPAAGMGLYFGLVGMGFENKQEIRPDFDQLFDVLGFYS